MILSANEQLRIIRKGTEAIVGEEDLQSKLERSVKENRPLVIKFGMDPSAPDLHLGHAVPLRKIRQMQELGHKAVIVIGDFTGRIGDPTGKAKGRVALTEEKVHENAMTYCEQVFKIIDKEKTEIRFNSEWLAKLNLEEVIRLAASTTVARILERDDFQNRYRNQTPIGLHEFFYPLLQAYDSVELHADIELGGTDQTFNVLMGRALQKYVGQEQQAAIFVPILTGLDGTDKMSKSLGNYIGISESAKVMFKKVMELPDELIITYYELTTDEHPDAVELKRKELADGRNPRDIKLELARIITKLYHSGEETELAEQYYHAAFSNKAIPDNIPELKLSEPQSLNDLIPELILQGFFPSRSEFVRLIKQGGVQKNGEKAELLILDELMKPGDVLRIGKKKFVRIIE